MINIVLLEPEIPANTGNIGRTCVATGSRLHLIEPLGFSINEKALKRAGLDSWEHLYVTVYESFEDFIEKDSREWGGNYSASAPTKSVKSPDIHKGLHGQSPIIHKGSPLK
jgi:tRNA (cytidine/uridine-2'-O-)-methyltransferase